MHVRKVLGREKPLIMVMETTPKKCRWEWEERDVSPTVTRTARKTRLGRNNMEKEECPKEGEMPRALQCTLGSYWMIAH